ncbi:LLM class flavin-dependent oxidoreductase [Pseudactinotalea sp. Z1732]|uniref:LLM class flavin-dependent oxidoreductase n=1 Tax=Micrococcales TaxID=85006 RepID=UPI003C7AEC11
MKYALSIPPFTDVATVMALGREAEDAGWDGVFLWDHVQWTQGMEVHDPWVLLGALAQATERVVLGPLVTPLSRRRPWVVAKQITTLDHLSNGRAVLGVGLGEPPDLDFADLGDEADGKVRAAMLDEGLDLIDQLWRGPTDFDGEHYRVRANFLPRPIQQRPPIWVAGGLPNVRPLRRARRWDGIAPMAESLPTPRELVAYLDQVPPAAEQDGEWDVVAPWAEGVPAQEYADAGVTWLVVSAWPTALGWVDEMRRTINTALPR